MLWIVVVFDIIAFESSCFRCNTQTFLHFWSEKIIFTQIKLAKLFSIKFSVDWCYFSMILKQKIQKSLIITTKTCTRIHIFKCIYLDGENDSDDAVKTKNAQFFMIFPNISFFHMIVTEWPGPLSLQINQKFLPICRKLITWL